MSAKVSWYGLDALRAELRRLPEDLKAEGGEIVLRRATAAESRVVAGYEAHRRTGNLASHVSIVVQASGPLGSVVVVKSTARHAALFEIGTQARHTSLGANRGSMPAAHVFVPVMVQERRTMYEELAELLRRHGLAVSGV